VPAGVRPADIFAPLAAIPHAQLLDWQGGDGVAYILAEPAETLTIPLRDLAHGSAGGAFARLQAALDAWAGNGGHITGDAPVPFYGGAAGVFAYELAYDLEHLPARDGLDPLTPVLSVGFYDAVLALPAAETTAVILSPWDTAHTRAKRARLKRRIATATVAPPPSPIPCPRPRATVTPDAYRAAIARVIALIHAGDIFQANLAQRFETVLPDGLTPFDIYRRLAGTTPAPFAAHLTLDGRTYISSSPERFVKITPEGDVRTEPIKGTRPRGATPGQDARLARELLTSGKDRAENIMIVDLLRNDLSKVCADHSVTVDALCALHSFANVHHLISTVTGTLTGRTSPLACLRACFPGGSITGAPKVRAMEIIRQEEPHPRGVYCGAIGFVGLNGAMDTSISIRTLTIDGTAISYHAGGGIVADSNPDAEYAETLTKASAIRAALTNGAPAA